MKRKPLGVVPWPPEKPTEEVKSLLFSPPNFQSSVRNPQHVPKLFRFFFVFGGKAELEKEKE